MIGAVFAEWAGADAGLGHALLTANGQLETARAFAATLLLFLLADRPLRRLRAARAAGGRLDPSHRTPEDHDPPPLLALLALRARCSPRCGEKAEPGPAPRPAARPSRCG